MLNSVEVLDPEKNGAAGNRSEALRRHSLFEQLRRPGVLPFLLAAVSSLLYCGTLAFHFVHYDDRKQIIENAAIKSWSFVPAYFTGNVWALVDPHKAGNYYRPLFLLWLKINYALFGLSAGAWHGMSVLLEALVTAQVFWLARRLLQSDKLAAASALLFAIHPVHIESVAWISGVTDPLAAACMLGSTILFLRFLDGAPALRRADYVGSLILAALALLAKEIAVALPFLLIFTAMAARRGETRWSTVWKSAAPFFALVIAYVIVRHTVLRGFSHPVEAHTFRVFLLTMPSVLCFYLRQLVAPFWISPFANIYWVQQPSVREFWAPLAVCGLVLVGAFTAYQRSRRRELLLALYAWLLLPLLPALYILAFPQAELVHDRYLYVPSVGFSILAAIVVSECAHKLPRRVAVLAGAAVLATLVWLTFAGELLWGSELLLFKHAVEIAPNNDGALLNLGIAYVARNQPDEGMPFLAGALQRNPNCELAAFDIGHYFFVNHRNNEAEKMMIRAISIDPFHDDWWGQLADVELALGNIDQADRAINQAIHLRADGPGLHLTLGAVLLAEKDCRAAGQAFREELKLFPQDATARQAFEGWEVACR